MKKEKKVELHEQSIEELKKMLMDTQKELASARLDHSRGKIKNVRTLRSLRTVIARVKTVLRGKELASYGKNA